MKAKKSNVIIIILAVLLLLPACRVYGAQQPDVLIEWNPVCRHNTLFWISVVRDQYPVRVAFGKVLDSIYEWHVQPQLKLGKNWYYFEVRDGSVYIILDMSELYEGWFLLYYMDENSYANWLFGWDLKERE